MKISIKDFVYFAKTSRTDFHNLLVINLKSNPCMNKTGGLLRPILSPILNISDHFIILQ
jgi:hypothetical protein